MEILQTTKLFDLFKEYPQLEDRIINIAPPFKNLKNPILRKTVGKLATIEKVAQIGKLDPFEFVNMLREIVGVAKLQVKMDSGSYASSDKMPKWISGKPAIIVDGVEMLEKGEHPLNTIIALLKEISEGQFILLKTNFAPLPLIETLKDNGYKTYHIENNNDHKSFFGK